jgi:GTP-binding protein
MKKPLVALVGRPNVGKSTLFNRLVGQRKSVTSDIPGTTRDRIYGDVDWNGVLFALVDTGGIEINPPSQPNRPKTPLEEGSAGFVEEIKGQALIAIQEADVLVLVVDVLDGLTAADEEVAEILRRSPKPIIVAANKAESNKRMEGIYDFYALSVGEVVGISAMHGTGTGDLLDAIVKALPRAPEFDPEQEDETLKIAIVGRPNVGKSSLLNRLLGEERAIVSPIAGTTRDAVDTLISYHNQILTLVDTAGIRRRGKVEPGIEKYSVLRAMKAIERADVVLLVIDGVEGLTAQDQHIAGMILEAYKSVVVLVNKWDALDKDNHTYHKYEEKLRRELAFMPYAPLLFISAKTGQRIHKVLETALLVYEERLRRVQTSELNRIVREALDRHAPATKQPRKLKIYYATQVRVDPPTFLFHINDKKLLHHTYERYLEKCLRAEYPFTGTPIRFSFRPREGGLTDDRF